MKRRDFLTGLLTTGGLTTYGSAESQGFPSPAPPADPARISRVLVVFKCHLDVGFIDTQAAVMRKHFDQYFPQAMELAGGMRQSGSDRYVWTTGSWLLYEYLEQASSEQRKRMEEGVAAGDVAWHALPFTWETEVLDRSMIEGALGFSKSLDRRFGRTTTGAKMTDVPGHTRGLVGPLVERGVKFLDIGVNSASTPPDVPSLFLWKDTDGASLIVMYHREYGGVVEVPGSDLAVAMQVRDDNAGPHSLDEVKTIYQELRKQFPNAKVTASNLTEVANAVSAFGEKLPVITQEIGDTWIYGVPSDPLKVARFRELMRLRREWIQQGKLRAGDATDLAFLRRFLLVAEHTWGTDTKTYLDHDHYTPRDLAQVLEQPKYKTMTTSWTEKREDIDQGVASLPAPLRSQAAERLRSLQAAEPATAGLSPYRAESEIETAHFVVALDSKTGAIRRLRSKKEGREWASPEHALGLFSYQTLSKEDYDRFLKSYLTVETEWGPQDFGKPNIERFGAQSRIWQPSVVKLWSGENAEGHRILVELQIDDPETQQSGRVAWPRKIFFEVILPKARPVVELNFTWFGKSANRLPEAAWLSFLPNAPDVRGWTLEKSDRPVSPLDVVRGGNRHMHSVTREIRYRDSRGSFIIETLDAPVVALGVKSPLYFSNEQPDLTKGLHFSLFNNAWGTNYPQWFEGDMRFRFILHASQG